MARNSLLGVGLTFGEIHEKGVWRRIYNYGILALLITKAKGKDVVTLISLARL